jgi:hypothetical protein
MSALLSFLGGSAFRLIWAQIASYIDKQQDHKHEVERMTLQSGLDKSRHEQDCARLRLQSDLGVKEIMVSADAEVSKLEAEAFMEAMKNAVPQPTGIKWVDAWNNVIRPAGATLGYLLVFLELLSVHFVMNDWHRTLVGTMLGFWFASRELQKGIK